MRLLATIGLDAPLVERLSSRVDARVVSYPAPPRFSLLDGRMRIESQRVAGKFIDPDAFVFYGYFDDARDVRRALALSSSPTFPDVCATLPLDDRILALAMALRADGDATPRGYLPRDATHVFDAERVVKWGDRHCGDGKARVAGPFTAEAPTIVEPFLVGTSERALVVGDRAWHLRYESDDWRKNVRATVHVIEPQDASLIARARRTMDGLGLAIAGVDYLVHEGGAALLEVNAYPGLDDVEAAQEAFVEEAARWFARAGDASR